MLNLEERKAWVFDLDGTLTKPVHDFADIRRRLGTLTRNRRMNLHLYLNKGEWTT